MACGCGGSSRSAEKAPREQVVRRAQEQPRAASRAPVRIDDPGFVWQGPQRGQPEPEPATQQ